MFLKLDEIARELDEICLPLEQEGITGMRLLAQSDASASTRALENAQEALGVKFPLALSRLVCEFDFGEFEICNVRFGTGGDYTSELVRLNSTDEYGGKWWHGDTRPANLIVFAVGDPWIFLLDCADGAIYAWLLGDEELCGRRVAGDFDRFFRALASIGIAQLGKKAAPSKEEIAKFVQAGDDKALEFWRETAEI
ncbi:SMI1/KNR4 family protein [Campylobacter sp.]|uniref:SMI1/KNR4 family protein n=1 Tax=Campylobacter sp. TaxID=205 RepID=UPI00361AC830